MVGNLKGGRKKKKNGEKEGEGRKKKKNGGRGMEEEEEEGRGGDYLELWMERGRNRRLGGVESRRGRTPCVSLAWKCRGMRTVATSSPSSSSSSHRFARTKIEIFADRRPQPIWVSILAVSAAPDASALSVSQTEVVSAILIEVFIYGLRSQSLRAFDNC
ncbi:hypothetical protein M5K25_022094 [Dendrobium thyrsiflorum]|uniref:Uncharacterized protein n=1 Tax=Dendrobium thyrsiflorum TaxID=117978 RepID=A0ABD0UBG4_DENTH